MLHDLGQDHSIIAQLLDELGGALDHGRTTRELGQHLDGMAAIMENHFRYEEHQLLTVLDDLKLDVAVTDALGPL